MYDILGMALLNMEHPSQVWELGKHDNWSNMWNTSQLKGFTKQVQNNFNLIQEKIMQLQQKCEMHQE